VSDITIPEARKTPAESGDFEREQLRFLLAQGSAGEILARLNPSLAWLPIITEFKVIEDVAFIGWIERNFDSFDALKEVVANLAQFTPETALTLEYRLNAKSEMLPSLLTKCWRLVIQQIKASKRGLSLSDWFELEPRLKQGDTSTDILERIARVAQPKLRLGPRISYFGEPPDPPVRPSDLMDIDFEPDQHVAASTIIEAWPKAAAAETIYRFLGLLTDSLESALAFAIDLGVEMAGGYGISDSDVPSVAPHGQNTYRTGFHIITSLIVGMWNQLSEKSPSMSIALVERWSSSEFKLVRRLALYGALSAIVPIKVAVDLLQKLPPGELFLTGSTVEVLQLILRRWAEFPESNKKKIMGRLIAGPPESWFREGSDVHRAIDRARYDLVGEMRRAGLELTDAGEALILDIEQRYPAWQLRPPEQAGFHVWVGSVEDVEPGVAKDLPIEELVARVQGAESQYDLSEASRELVRRSPERALQLLEHSPSAQIWNIDLVRALIASRESHPAGQTDKIARLLLEWPKTGLREIAEPASEWLTVNVAQLSEELMWKLWDRLATEVFASGAMHG
jgi:hypothetical protein